jgi:hypothetical protein
MNLPYPFQSARGLEPDAFGRIALVDESGKVLTHLSLEAAYELTPESSGYLGYGYGYGFGDGHGYGYGYGYGNGYSVGDGRGKSS